MNVCVVGNGTIVKRFLEDVRDLAGLNVGAICVREPSREKARALAQQYRIGRIETDYGIVMRDPAIDTIYIGIVNDMHYLYAKQALESGKHVICEKPFTVDLRQAEELAALAKENSLFLWEASKVPYSETYRILRDNLPLIGTPRLVRCNYSRRSSRYTDYLNGVVHPAFDPKKAGGSLYDINVYNLHLTALLFGMPKAVHYYANLGPGGIDLSGTAVLEYDGFHALCTGCKDSTSPSGAVIQGEDGYLRVEGPASSASRVWLCQNGEERCLAELKESGRLTEEIKEFVRQYTTGDYESCSRMLEHSLLVMRLISRCRNKNT